MFLQPQQDAFPDIQTNINFMRQNHQHIFEIHIFKAILSLMNGVFCKVNMVATCSMPGVRFMICGKTVLPPSPQAILSSALSATTALLSLSSSCGSSLTAQSSSSWILLLGLVLFCICWHTLRCTIVRESERSTLIVHSHWKLLLNFSHCKSTKKLC